MTTLLENPTPVIFIGILVEAVLAIALVKTGRGVLLFVMLGVAAVVGGLVLLEWLVVTERERVEMTLDGCARALEANDADRVLSYIAPTAAHTRAEARRALDWIEFTKLKITDMQVTINELTSPPTARAECIVVVSGRMRRGEFETGTRPIRLSVDLHRGNEQWFITNHDVQGAPGF